MTFAARILPRPHVDRLCQDLDNWAANEAQPPEPDAAAAAAAAQKQARFRLELAVAYVAALPPDPPAEPADNNDEARTCIFVCC